MKIVIPEEYQRRFGSERAWIKPKGGGECIVQDFTPVFVTRWMGHGLLLMNGEERNQLVWGLERENGILEGLGRLTKADIKPVMLVDGAVEAPEVFDGWIDGKSLNFREEQGFGVLV